MTRPSAQGTVQSLLAAAAVLCGVSTASAQAAPPLRSVVYRGFAVTVPRSWPVFNLARSPRTCVRFNRHAVYLGAPSPVQECPAHAAGRAAAIELQPLAASTARAGGSSGAAVPEGRATSFTVPAAGLRVTATWARDRAVIVRALHRRTLPRPGAPRGSTLAARSAAARGHTAAGVYTGLGFDACSAPSTRQMSAWSSSPYRALGIYVGGVNAACSQANLNASWVSTEVAAGWHLIPTYVGLQAPSNSCGCAAISPSQATAQGTAAAKDAVSAMQTLGIPHGNPVYDDMESYPRGGTNTAAVLNFLSGWTAELHGLGYLSGVYSSAGSGITDLVNAYGTGYAEPDDIWIADWNGQRTTSDPYVPASDWQNHQRLHQYEGGHNETYGGVTINIDTNYLDGATASTSGAQATPASAPALTISPASDGTTNLSASWSGASGVSAWRLLAGPSQSALSMLAGTAAQGTRARFSVRSAAPYFAVQALGAFGQILASSATVATPAHLVLYGRSAFVNAATGTGGIPAGCYTGSTCHIATTLWAGATMVARTSSESIYAGGTGILYFTLTPQGRSLLRRARGARLPVRVSAQDAGGTASTTTLSLIPFSTSGHGPARAIAQSSAAQFLGVTDFVFAYGAGGVLARCATLAPCRISATLRVGRTPIATSGPQTVGGGELGYVYFSLTTQGRALLNRAPGNQLGANVTLNSGTATATATLALVQFS